MTIPYSTALNAIRQRSAAQLRQSFNGLTLAETVELGTFVGHVRLRAITMVSQGDAATLLAEINKQAFNVTAGPVPGQVPPQAPNSDMKEQVRLAILHVANRRRNGPLLNMPSDATATLPQPNSNPVPLIDVDYEAAAKRQRVEMAAIKAVAAVESGGAGFDNQGRPKILYEAHHFGPRTQNRFARTHPHLSLTELEWRGSRRFYPWNQYQRLYEAMLLDVDAALMAASWGKFQVMGFNHNGWPDVRSFVPAMYVSETNHLKAFEAFCNDNRLMGFVRAKSWLSFALGYNGKQQQGYDVRIRNEYQNIVRTMQARRQ